MIRRAAWRGEGWGELVRIHGEDEPARDDGRARAAVVEGLTFGRGEGK